ncbi:sigma-70 family RNA polymerase sigma factor [Planctomycetota bacterium]|nr:sigma-70 family RNA polymerase sigma factor [Planctomycetota bacterium]
MQEQNALVMDEQAREEEQLLRDLQEGSAEAVNTMIQSHGDAVFRFVWGKIRDRHRAEDLTQECMMKAVRAIRKEGSKPRQRVRAWLFVIARHVVLDYLRYKQRRNGGELSLEGVSESQGQDERGNVGGWIEGREEGPSEAMEQDEARDKVKLALAALPEDQRDVIELRMWDGLSFGEIANVLDIPEATAKSRMRYGLSKLHDLLAGSCEKEVLL